LPPLVSMICITNRPGFEEAVRRQFLAQTYPRKQLVVIDSSDGGGLLRDVADVYVRKEPWTPVGAMRNAGLDATAGDWFMWFDDDDWRAPDLTTDLMLLAKGQGSDMAGLRSFFWLDVDGRMEKRDCPNWPVFGAAVYRNDRPVWPFRTKPVCKTDSWWLLRILAKVGRWTLLDKAASYVWVNHGSNVFNRSYDTECRKPDERDARFLEGTENSLSLHMELIRGALV